MSGARLLALLDERLRADGVAADQPVTVAELHKRLVPYHVCRERLGYASKAEYDAQILALLADGRTIGVSDSTLRDSVQEELGQPEPGLGFLHRFAATEIMRVGPRRDAPTPAESAPEDDGASEIEEAGAYDEADAEAVDESPDTCRECSAPLPHAAGAWFCPACGTDQRLPRCPDCGVEVHEDWRYCAFCGILRDRTQDG